jgi:hypothetical protein
MRTTMMMGGPDVPDPEDLLSDAASDSNAAAENKGESSS